MLYDFTGGRLTLNYNLRKGEGVRSEFQHFCETETQFLLSACTETLAQFA